MYYDTKPAGGHWSYSLCPLSNITQFRTSLQPCDLLNSPGERVKDRRGGREWSNDYKFGLQGEGEHINLGTFRKESVKGRESIIEVYEGGDVCEGGEIRRTDVRYECCEEGEGGGEDEGERKWIKGVEEVETCVYIVKVCDVDVCEMRERNGEGNEEETKTAEYHEVKKTHTQTGAPHTHPPQGKVSRMGAARKISNREKVRNMFTHGYDSYMKYGAPNSEVKPISCKGQLFDLSRTKYLTLIDSMDLLIIMGNYTEFARSVERVRYEGSNTIWMEETGLFAVDQNVSVFETSIRSLGGLLSSHLMALRFIPDGVIPLHHVFDSNNLVRDDWSFPDNTTSSSSPSVEKHWSYDGSLLTLAQDLADRLLPAFETSTGIPYGTVNLVKGVPKGETTIASLAGGGSMTLEFELLTRLTGEPVYGFVAMRAVKSLWRRRSSLGLLGKHIDVVSGRWVESVSGIGSNSDSFYEYLGKYAYLYDDDEAWIMFKDAMLAVSEHCKDGPYYADVDMEKGGKGGLRRRFER
jgi:hypothetical protein